MINKPNWEETKKRYLEYWARENHERPIMYLTAPKKGAKMPEIKAPDSYAARRMDTEYVVKMNRAKVENTYYGAEAFPHAWPDLGPDILIAYCGCELRFEEQTSWAIPIIEDWETRKPIKIDRDNLYWKKTVELTKAFQEDSKGDFLVTMTDLHPGCDGISSMRGQQNFLYDMYDEPEQIKKAVWELYDAFVECCDFFFDMTNTKTDGTCNWMNLWHPGKYYVTSADVLYSISEEMFEEFIRDELQAELNYLDNSIFHLDGVGALRHLDSLLKMPRLDGIQWMYGAGKGSAKDWIPVLKKIQDAGKLIQVDAIPEDIPVLAEYLKPEGLMLNICTHDLKNPVHSEDEARELEKLAEKCFFKRKVF